MSVVARFYVSGLERNAYQPDATIVKMQPAQIASLPDARFSPD